MPAQDVPLKLAAGSHPNRIRQVGDARLINLLPEQVKDGRAEFALYPRNGLRRVALADGGACRGLFEIDEGRAYWLAGTNLYQFGVLAQPFLVGAIPGSGTAYFARNRRPATQVACVAAGAAYLIQSSGITRMNIPAPSTGFVAPIDCAFLDGYLLFISRAGQMHFTAIDNAENLSALNYITAEGNPDGLRRIIVRKREAWLFGDRTIEVWVTTSNVDQPFDRLGGGFLEQGILAPQSLQHHSRGLTWIDDDGIVRHVAEGYNAAQLSDPSVERSIEDDPNKTSITSLSYIRGGHAYYAISGSSWTWVHDFSTGSWLEYSTEPFGRWRAQHAVAFDGSVYAGDMTHPRLYEISPKALTDDDLPIIKTARLPIVQSEPAALAFFNVRASVSVGLGSADVHAPAEDQAPQLRLRWSDDGGSRWSPYRLRPMGKRGETRKIVRYSDLGQSGPAGRMFEFSTAASVEFALTGVTASLGQVTYP